METLPVPSALPDITSILAGQLTQSSIRIYQSDVRAYARFADERGLSQFHPQTLIAWRDHLAIDTEMSPNTINRMLCAIRRIVKEAAAREVIPPEISYAFNNVTGVSTKALKGRLKQHSRTRIWPEDMRRLCEAPDVTTLVGLRDRALLATLASSGLRVSEAVSLRYEQIEQQGPGYMLKIIGKSDVTPRDAHLSVEAKGLIDAWLAARPVESDYIFTSFSGRGVGMGENSHLTARPLSDVGAWRIVGGYAEACGLAHIKPHDFRRFVGTILAKRDIRLAQKALGHARIDTTAAHYILDELTVGATDNLY